MKTAQLRVLCHCPACLYASYQRASAPIVLATSRGKMVWRNAADGLTFKQFKTRAGVNDAKPKASSRYTIIELESLAARGVVPHIKDRDS